MRILVIGSGGREHALVWKIGQSRQATRLYCVPGNAGICGIAQCLPLNPEDFQKMADFVIKEKIDLTVVGPEVPLARGIVDFFNERGLPIYGPNQKAAQLEASKVFSKNFLKKYGIPTAGYHVFSDAAGARAFLDGIKEEKPLVVKADGLAAGKGVIICPGVAEAKDAVRQIMEDNLFGSAGSEIVIEDFLEGEEASVQVFLDGKHYQLMAAAQDHKRVFDNDQGPNTGGMGTYAPAPIINEQLKAAIETKLMAPIMKGLAAEGIDYRGVLYLGLMMVKGEPYVLEFNCRFGDPETQVVLPLLKTDLVDIIQNTLSGTLDKIKIEWYNKAAVCVVLASGGYPGEYAKGKEIRGIADAEKLGEIMVFHAGTSANAAGTLVTSGGRVLGVTALGADIPAAIRAAYSAVQKISFEGMHYRTDIGKRALKHF